MNLDPSEVEIQPKKKTITRSQIHKLADAHSVAHPEAEKQFTDRGYEIKE